MTTRRNKDLVLPAASQYRNEFQIFRDIDISRTNATSRWAKDNHSDAPSRFRHPQDPGSAKIAALARPKLETSRANSPTFKRLVAVRAKLEKYVAIISRIHGGSRQSGHSAHEPQQQGHVVTQDKPPTMISHSMHTITGPTLHGPLGFSHEPSSQFKSQSSLTHAPLDKITYEKLWTNNGNLKQKCSLEIWLPKANVEDEEILTSHTLSRTSSSLEKKSPPVVNIRSRRSSILKAATTTATNLQQKPIDESPIKKSEPVRPRVYHYTDYIMEPSEERPRSGKSVTTVKSDGTGSIKSHRRYQNRSQTRRQSVSTSHSEEILRFTTTEVSPNGRIIPTGTKPMTVNSEKKPSAPPTSQKQTNPSMITELMQKYSLMKKNHQELIQTRLQLEKNQAESRSNLSTTKNDSSLIRTSVAAAPVPPPVPESTSLISPDHPSVSVKKLLLDTSTSRLLADHSLTNSKLLERRATPRKPSYPDVFAQSRVYALNHHPHSISHQHRQSSASIPTNAVLPTVVGKKTEPNLRFFQRSKTLDIVLDLPNDSFNSGKGTSRYSTKYESSSSNFMQQSSNSVMGTLDQSPSRFARRSVTAVRPHQQQVMTPIVQIVHNPEPRQRHASMTRHIPSSKILVQFNANNHRNSDRQCLVPDS